MIWIVFENKAYSQIVGSRQAPTSINSPAGVASQRTTTRSRTRALPNYIALTSGGTRGIKDDEPPASHRLKAPTIYSQLKNAGKSWRNYEESASSNCPLTSRGLYAVKHDPAPYFVNVRADCAVWDVPMGTTTSGALISDLREGSLPDFALVTPNLCNDMHSCSVRTGDKWLEGWMQPILASSAYRAGRAAVFVTFDEDDGSRSNRVATIVVSPSTPARIRSAMAFTHYSLLRTTEEMLGLSLLGHAGDAGTASMRSAFHL